MRIARLPQGGFSLIEMIIVMVILSIAALAVTTMIANLGDGAEENSDMQVGAQLLQECGEWIVAQHRRDESFYDTLSSSTTCAGLSSYGGFGEANLVVVDTGIGCPTGKLCKKATITVTKDGSTLNSINLIVVKYN